VASVQSLVTVAITPIPLPAALTRGFNSTGDGAVLQELMLSNNPLLGDESIKLLAAVMCLVRNALIGFAVPVCQCLGPTTHEQDPCTQREALNAQA
jgi:hypothetical protein